MHIWSLPGPSSFVDNIEDSVRDGASVIARFPSEAPSGLERELKERLHSVFQWNSIDASQTDSGPLTLVLQAICPGAIAFEASSITKLALTDSFQGRLVWIEKIDSGMWPEWSRFLRAYSDACRNVDILNRTVFVVLLSGKSVTCEVPEEVALVRCDFRGAVDTLDLFIFALRQVPANVKCREHRALMAHTVAQVAQWDSLLAEQLLALPLAEALSPEATLVQYALDRGWTVETPECWEEGTVNGPTERPTVHSALLEVCGKSRLVRQRIWAAQAAVLLPLVEERRVGLVGRYGRHLELPIRTEDGRWVYDPLDLEVGFLAWFLDRPGSPWRLRKQVRRLRDVRNKLAHMEPLEPAQALHRMLFTDP